MIDDIKSKLGKRIKEIRIKGGYSQEELASLAKLHRTHISDIERGGRSVSVENIEKIAKALNIERSELLEF